MDNKKEEKYVVVEGFSIKRLMRYKLFLIIIFLIITGIISYFLLPDEAQKLAAYRRYSEFSSNNVRSHFNLIEKIKYAIETLTKEDDKNKKSIATAMMEESQEGENSEVGDDKNFQKNISKENANFSNNNSQALTNRNSFSLSNNSNTQKLESSLSPLSASVSESVSKTSLSSFASSSSPKIKIKETTQIGVSQGRKAEEDKTAMGLLRSTFKTTLMAARDASNDTARAWTSKTFDYTPTINQTIEYDEKLRAKLDRINPNSIPAFLKDPALDPESMKSLKVSEVPGLSKEDDKNNFEIDMEDIKDKMQEYKKKKSLLDSLASLNPLFNMKNSDEELTDEEIDKNSYSVNMSNSNIAVSPDSKVVNNPSDKPSLGNEITNVVTDEYGYIRVTQKDGTIQIFDPNTGKILGCEIPSAGMCALPGVDNCPKDVYFI
ncbi:MAG: hypothetical protein N2446_02400 [Elusimicrobiales bacterium]|nr:hypothetical protein [Elusimicrobiales bacterium]